MDGKKTFLLVPFLSALLFSVLDILALHYHLFWRLWWYDIPMHILGGLTLGLLGIWLVALSGLSKTPYTRRRIIIVAVAFTIGIGVIWEFVEYSIGFTFNTVGSYPLDTAKDLFMDFVGAFAALAYSDGILFKTKIENRE